MTLIAVLFIYFCGYMQGGSRWVTQVGCLDPEAFAIYDICVGVISVQVVSNEENMLIENVSNSAYLWFRTLGA